MTERKPQWWAHVTHKPKTLLGPFDTREAAIEAVLVANPKAKEVTSGYGAQGPYFDIRWSTKKEAL